MLGLVGVGGWIPWSDGEVCRGGWYWKQGGLGWILIMGEKRVKGAGSP